MIDAKRYIRLEPLGVTSVVRTEEGGLALRFKRFEPETGTELDVPELQPFNVEDLQFKAVELEIELAGIRLLLKKCETM